MALSRQKKVLLFLIIFILFLVIGFHLVYLEMIYRNIHSILRRRVNLFYNLDHNQNQNGEEGLTLDLSSSPYLVNTQSCSIPKTPLFPPFFQNEWRIESLPDCQYEIENFFLSDDEKTLTFTPRNEKEKCCVQGIGRSNTSKKYSLSPCNPSNEETTSVTNKEMFAVTCESSLNVEAIFPIKPNVKRKVDYWSKNIEVEDSNQPRPPNILILGIDSVSRLHTHRSIPRTIKLLNEMNFLEFQGYHSVGASTLSNFMPLLTGFSLEEIRQICAPSWKSSFDDCPFIWKLFNNSNYVTNFLEDGEGSFSWGGQGGFKTDPTDYYIYPLFQALKDLRLKSFGPKATWWTHELYRDCVSSESVPQFLLRYTRKFIQTFSDTPFFSFTWLAYPFHEHIYSLAGYDDDLAEFFQGLRDDSPIMFENTIIILLSDHGDRTSFFQSSIEGFIERSLPPLFIRIPEIFEEKFPHLAVHINAMKNMKKLTTPWDIHHTLLHTMSLFSPSSIQVEKFPTNLQDRASLFTSVSNDRSCELVNIPSKHCVCDTVVNQVIVNAPVLLKQIVRFVGEKLNEIVRNSKYRDVCHEWVVRKEDVLSFKYIGGRSGRNVTDHLVVFSAEPGDARFEARLTVSRNFLPGRNEFDIKLKGQLSRINRYGNQSSCVSYHTDADKEMKEFCFCR